MVLFFGKSITISSSNFRFSSTTDYILGNKVLWSVDTLSCSFLFCSGLFYFLHLELTNYGLMIKLLKLMGLFFDNKVIDVWWGNRNDLTDGQIKTFKAALQ